MRYFKKICCTAIAGLAALASCTDAEHPVAAPTMLDLSFTVDSTASRQYLEDNIFPSGTQVGITAVDMFATDGVTYNGKSYYNIPVTLSDGSWTIGQDIPLTIDRACVYSYYPYSSTVTDINAIPFDITTSTDYMYGSPTTVNSKKNSTAVTMNRILSRIRVLVQRISYEGTGSVTGFTFSSEGFTTAGTYNARTGEITDSDGLHSLADESDYTLGSDIHEYTFHVASLTIANELTFCLQIDGTELVAGVSGITLQKGSEYTFLLTLGDGSFHVENFSITDWTDNDMADNSVLTEPDEDSYVSLVYSIAKNTTSYYIFNKDFDVSLVDEMYINGVSVTPTVLYQYPKAGYYNVKVKFKDNIIPDNAFATNTPHLCRVKLSNIRSIGYRAFYSAERIKGTLRIPDECTSIGDEAFAYCDSITFLYLGQGVQTIGSYAFRECGGLSGSTITIPASCQSFDGSTFYGSTKGNHNIQIDGSNPYISNDGKSIIQTVSKTLILGSSDSVIPDDCTAIGKYAFYNCKSLSSITIPESVTSIGDYAFYNCTGLTALDIPDGVETIGDRAFSHCEKLVGELTIPGSVSSIGDYAFSYCKGISLLTIPGSISEIPEQAFAYCSGLTSVTIGNGVTIIGNKAFYYCEAIESLQLPNTLTTIVDRAFCNCIALNPLILPNTIQEIGSYSFYECNSLSSVSIPGTCTSLGDYCFYGCDNLSSINIDDGISIIPNSCFRNCINLVSVYIPNSVFSIQSHAFRECTNLNEVRLGTGLMAIYSYAFGDCLTLSSIISYATSAPSISNYAFHNIANRGVLKVPSGCSSSYSEWMNTEKYYLGYYGWTIQEMN